MGGSSLGGMFGGPSTIGSNAYAPANTTPSVMGATGKLEAFNPATMAGTYNTPTAPTMQDFNSAGMDAATGLPSYVTNFLQQGGTGTLKAPQFTMDPGAGVEHGGRAEDRDAESRGGWEAEQAGRTTADDGRRLIYRRLGAGDHPGAGIGCDREFRHGDAGL
jgi:hypothetical protein